MDPQYIRKIVEQVVSELAQKEEGAGVNPDVAKGYIPIGISARHAHLSAEHLETLFGKGHQLTPYRDLLQKNEYASQETVTLVGPRMRSLEKVRILGPVRGNTQVEVSLTDAIQLGIRPPVRPSGNHEGTPGILIVGPLGFVELKQGVIRANRHIHISCDDAKALGLKDNDRVLVKVEADRPLVYYDVQIRVKESFVAQMHLDTDDANAAGVSDGDKVKIILSESECRICDIRR
ncbi:phosphate propanoyltransferase [Candidatus Sumerlaeota bacterium]|nr:phosphate propanoyltransferase [Candidatus Sumerlaeota bacterium]